MRGERVLTARLDSLGDMLVTGPAIRAVAARAAHVTMLCGPIGRPAAELLPGIDEIIEWRAEWIIANPAPVDAQSAFDLVHSLRQGRFDRAILFTAEHHTPLPLALLCKLAGIGSVAGISADRAGSLLDVRLRDGGEGHEAERCLRLADAAGFPSRGETGLLVDLPNSIAGDIESALPASFVVLHPGASVPARRWSEEGFVEVARCLRGHGLGVVVTGEANEAVICNRVAEVDSAVVNLAGRCDLRDLAWVYNRASAVVVANTGPAHLAAAVGTPVVSLFAPTVPVERWRPWGVPSVLFGDHAIECASCRVDRCPFEGHPCMTVITSEQVAHAAISYYSLSLSELCDDGRDAEPSTQRLAQSAFDVGVEVKEVIS